MLRNEVLQLRADKNRLEAENVSLREELSTMVNNQNNDTYGNDTYFGGTGSFDNGNGSGMLKGGRPRQFDGKSPLSMDGGGIKGRPPPGAAGRGLREAHEKVEGERMDVYILLTYIHVYLLTYIH
jgi:hypothetical protein